MPDPIDESEKRAMDEIMLQDMASDAALVEFLQIPMPKRYQRILDEAGSSPVASSPVPREDAWISTEFISLAPEGRALLFLVDDAQMEGRIENGRIVLNPPAMPGTPTLFRLKPQRTERRGNRPDNVGAILAKQEGEFERHVIDVMKARFLAEFEAEPVEEPEPAQLLPPADTRLADYGPVGTDDITGDLLLEAFEHNEAETAAIVQTLSALRLKHLSEQLNVERARLDREHQATGVANPRSASIDRLLGLLTRRGEV